MADTTELTKKTSHLALEREAEEVAEEVSEVEPQVESTQVREQQVKEEVEVWLPEEVLTLMTGTEALRVVEEEA